MPSRSRLVAAAMGATAMAAAPATVIASTYVVHPGDTLTQIALRHGTTVSALVQANGIENPNLIRVGQMLQIPDPTRALPQYAQQQKGDDETYAVKAGDNLYGIARHFGVDVTALARANGINVNTHLAPGAVLQVPGRLVRMNALLVHIAGEVGVDPKLVKAVAWMESGWQQDVVSPTGAIGVMQVEPYTGEWVSEHIAHRRLNLRAAEDNVYAGALLLKNLLGRHGGDASAALAAYYQGDASIAEHGLYEDTQQYVRVVLAIMARE